MRATEALVRVLVAGVGYTGRRLMEQLPAATTLGIGRAHPEGLVGRFECADLDRDGGPLQSEFAAGFGVVYTVPPASAAGCRVERLFAGLAGSPGRLVYLSSSGVYGDRGGALVDEKAKPRPETQRAGRRLAVEERLGQRCRETGTELVVLRVPGIYGPGRLGLDAIAAGRPVIAEPDAHPGNRIHVDDLAACCLAALDRNRPAGIYNVGDGDYRSGTWFATEVARQAGLAPPPRVSRDRAETEFSERRLSFLRESRRLEVGRMRDVLRPVLRYTDPADGIAASLAAAED